jgi:DNA-binding SARP family transcriptional activator
MAGLYLRTFGLPAIVDAEGRAVPDIRRKDVALLVYLSVERDRRHARSQLATLLWGDTAEERARHSLTQSLRRIQQATGALDLGRDSVSWEGPLATDLDAFTSTSDEDLSVYVRPFLDGFDAGSGAEDFHTWTDATRAALRSRALRILDERGAEAEHAGDWPRALRLARRAVDVDPLYEAAHRRVMTALARAGERNGALQHFDEFSRWLAQEIGGSPDPDTTALAREIRLSEEAAPSARTGSPPAQPNGAAAPEAALPGTGPQHRRNRWIAAGAVVAATTLVVWFARDAGSISTAETRPYPQVPGRSPLARAGLPCAAGSAVARFVRETYPDNVPLRPAEPFTKSWTLRNTGACEWDSRFFVRLEGGSGGRLSLTSPRLPIQRLVPPGDTYTVVVPMKAPTREGVHREDWSLRDAEGALVPVSSSNTIWAKVRVYVRPASPCTSADAVARFVGETIPDDTTLTAEARFTKRWTLRNGGACAWHPGIALRRVNGHAPLSGSMDRVELADTVEPGENHTFVVQMRAPSFPGIAEEHWYLSDFSGETIRVAASKTIWVRVVVPAR